MKPPKDHQGKPIRLITSMRGSDRLAVFYPGLNYTLMAPLFFFLGQALEDAGWDILGIDYRYNENPKFQALPNTERDLWFAHDAEIVGRWVKENTTAYRRQAVVTKSLGTAMLVQQIGLNLVDPDTDLVWWTPGTSAGRIFDTLETLPNRSLVAFGSADKYGVSARAATFASRPTVQLVEIPGAKHIFEETGNPKQTMENIARVVLSSLEFLGGRP